MNTWQTPKTSEIPAGMEIGAYAPAEMDGPPHVVAVASEANPACSDASLRRNAPVNVVTG